MAPKAPVSALPAAPPEISLLTSAVVVNERDRWEGGFAYEPESCGEGNGGAVDPCLSTEKALTDEDGSVDVEPFVIWAGGRCSAFGAAARDFQGRAQRKLLACQSNRIESELWRGTLARAATPDWPNKYLANLDSDVVTDSPSSPKRVLACLEQGLAECNCGAQGMIHAMPQVVTYWIAENLVFRDTSGGKPRLITALGTIVVPGSGYDGSGPPAADGQAPTAAADSSIWVYATGMVQVRLGPVVVIPDQQAEALNRSNNTLEYRAERMAAVTWDCCHIAAELDLTLCGIAGS